MSLRRRWIVLPRLIRSLLTQFADGAAVGDCYAELGQALNDEVAQEEGGPDGHAAATVST
jgi:hypothetical protein